MAQVLGLSRHEAAELLRKGDTDFILRAELPDYQNQAGFSRAESRLKQLLRIHPGAPFYAGILISGDSVVKQDAAAETKGSSSRRELEILLFCAALESPSLPIRQEAAGKLIPLILQSSGSGIPDGRELGASEAKNILAFLDTGIPKGKADESTTLLRAACLYRLGRYSEAMDFLRPPEGGPDSAGGWGKALALFAAWRTGTAGTGYTEQLKPDILAFLFALPEIQTGNSAGYPRMPGPGGETSVQEFLSWVYTEAFSLEGLLDPDESVVLSTRLSSSSYQTTLNNLRGVLSGGGLVFFRYPDLITVLGRAYQFTPAMREEGVNLFNFWDGLLEARGEGEAGTESPEEPIETPSSETPSVIPWTDEMKEELRTFIKSLDSETRGSLRYRLLYYSGRIERAREQYAASSEYFRRALDFAPDAIQSDACIWYLLMNSFSKDPSAAVSLALSTMPQWNDVSYFADVLDRLSCYLTAKRQWKSLLEIFSRLEGRAGAGASLAQYAWILGRAVQEGYLTTDHNAEFFFRVAFEEGNGSFYYRAMAASKLGETFAPEKDSAGTEKTVPEKTQKEEMEFLLGFFECGASSFALPYIQALEGEPDRRTAAAASTPQGSAPVLAVPDLRKIAERLAASGRWKESLDLISRYTSREDYEISREDLYLFYPRPFKELIEKNAQDAGLGAEILYGLIRTESYFMADVVSRSGAVGLAQLMVPTAADMAGRIARRGGPDYRGPNGIDLKDPEVNVHIGSFYLRYLTEQMGSPMLALLAYNGGMGRMRRWLAADRQQSGGLPLDLFLETIEYGETREYGRRVLAAAAVYGYLYYGMSMEEVAADIYR